MPILSSGPHGNGCDPSAQSSAADIDHGYVVMLVFTRGRTGLAGPSRCRSVPKRSKTISHQHSVPARPSGWHRSDAFLRLPAALPLITRGVLASAQPPRHHSTHIVSETVQRFSPIHF